MHINYEKYSTHINKPRHCVSEAREVYTTDLK